MKIFALSLFLLFPLLTIAQDKMEKHQINDEISYMVPSNFTLMSTSDRMRKFVSAREPLAMHSTMDREVDLGINWNPMRWTASDDEMVHGFYKASIQSMFDNVEFIQDGIQKVNGKNFIVFEFVSSLKSDNAFSGTKSSRYYTYIQYTSYNNQVLLFNFGCKARLMSTYQSVAKEIMNSVKVNEK
ncbi:hypothetical protein [Ekhidna sp. To15]|uniref:hypothetical protein n=1 Tax=Ekhidna sp. To15 TaxID=3395267 RepID=UPI003F51F5D8